MKIAFIDHWPNFRLENNYFFHLLKSAYELEVNQVDPDLLFLHTDSYRCFGRWRVNLLVLSRIVTLHPQVS
mgnify:CR=1 FL=1